jgi:hypothetical protein
VHHVILVIYVIVDQDRILHNFIFRFGRKNAQYYIPIDTLMKTEEKHMAVAKEWKGSSTIASTSLCIIPARNRRSLFVISASRLNRLRT